MSRALLTAGWLLLAAGCVRHKPLPLTDGDALRSKPLELTLPQYPGGQPFNLQSQRGNVVLLDVWATWCEPCRDALPTYEQLAKEYGAKGLKIYAINVDSDVKQIAPFLQETKVTLPILHDADAQFAEHQLRVKMMPTSFLIDRKGLIRHVHEGFAEEFLAQYQQEIEALLAEGK
jgi:cytochrome c biogenesis protein CcmG, thiol:disulfide interchange protein DsbE